MNNKQTKTGKIDYIMGKTNKKKADLESLPANDLNSVYMDTEMKSESLRKMIDKVLLETNELGEHPTMVNLRRIQKQNNEVTKTELNDLFKGLEQFDKPQDNEDFKPKKRNLTPEEEDLVDTFNRSEGMHDIIYKMEKQDDSGMTPEYKARMKEYMGNMYDELMGGAELRRKNDDEHNRLIPQVTLNKKSNVKEGIKENKQHKEDCGCKKNKKKINEMTSMGAMQSNSSRQTNQQQGSNQQQMPRITVGQPYRLQFNGVDSDMIVADGSFKNYSANGGEFIVQKSNSNTWHPGTVVFLPANFNGTYEVSVALEGNNQLMRHYPNVNVSLANNQQQQPVQPTQPNQAHENKKNKSNLMNEFNLKSKRPLNEGNVYDVLPAKYKVDGNVISISDGESSFKFKWEGDVKGEGVILNKSEKKMLKEELNKAFHLTDYNPNDYINTKTTVEGNANEIFTEQYKTAKELGKK